MKTLDEKIEALRLAKQKVAERKEQQRLARKVKAEANRRDWIKRESEHTKKLREEFYLDKTIPYDDDEESKDIRRKSLGLMRPEDLDQYNYDLWQQIKKFLGWDVLRLDARIAVSERVAKVIPPPRAKFGKPKRAPVPHQQLPPSRSLAKDDVIYGKVFFDRGEDVRFYPYGGMRPPTSNEGIFYFRFGALCSYLRLGGHTNSLFIDNRLVWQVLQDHGAVKGQAPLRDYHKKYENIVLKDPQILTALPDKLAKLKQKLARIASKKAECYKRETYKICALPKDSSLPDRVPYLNGAEILKRGPQKPKNWRHYGTSVAPVELIKDDAGTVVSVIPDGLQTTAYEKIPLLVEHEEIEQRRAQLRIDCNIKIRHYVEKFLVGSKQALKRTEMVRGTVFQDDTEYYFYSLDLLDWLTKLEVKITIRRLAEEIYKLGGLPEKIRVGGEVVSVWWLPTKSLWVEMVDVLGREMPLRPIAKLVSEREVGELDFGSGGWNEADRSETTQEWIEREVRRCGKAPMNLMADPKDAEFRGCVEKFLAGSAQALRRTEMVRGTVFQDDAEYYFYSSDLLAFVGDEDVKQLARNLRKLRASPEKIRVDGVVVSVWKVPTENLW
jgi:hypothetical protein